MLALRRLAALAVLITGAVGAQAPPLTDLWRVAGSTLPQPAALASGPTGVFWNPAALAASPPLRTGSFEILETPDVLALGGFLASGQWRMTPRIVAGAVVGRMAVTDLVRTTTSPIALPGEIPVHSQIAGLGVGWHGGPLVLGLLVRAHETRLDAIREGGLTTDAGLRWTPVAPITLAAATRFLGSRLQRNAVSELNVGLEGTIPVGSAWGSPARAVLGAGAGWHGAQHAEWGGGAVMVFSRRLSVSWGLTRERALEAIEWRHTLGLTFRTGHYTIHVARGEGLNGLGPTYRLGLTAATER